MNLCNQSCLSGRLLFVHPSCVENILASDRKCKFQPNIFTLAFRGTTNINRLIPSSVAFTFPEGHMMSRKLILLATISGILFNCSR